MAKIIDNAYLNLLEGLSLDLSLKLKNNKLGKKRSSARGSSVEFSDYREYMAGDDYRRIDWTALARFEKLFLKLFMEEQESRISIFLDVSKSMDFDSKKEVSLKTAAFFAFTSIKAYDTVSAMFFNDKIQKEIKNINTKQAFYNLLSEMEAMEYKEASNLLYAVESKSRDLRQGYSIIISDLLFDHKVDEVLKFLSFRKQKIIVCHVLDKNELYPDFGSNYRLIDSESLDEISVDQGAYTRDIYMDNLQSYLKEVEATCLKHGADYFMIDSELGVEAFIHNIIKINQGA